MKLTATKQKTWLKRPLAIVLSTLLVTTGFSMTGESSRVEAVESTSAPGGISDGLLSWVDVERSKVLNEGSDQISKLTDLVDNGDWTPVGGGNTEVPNALNFNAGIQIASSKGYFSRAVAEFGTDASSREVFSVQSSDNYTGFPWEFGGYGATSVYGGSNGSTIRTNFGREEGSLDVSVGDYNLKDGALLSIWSAPNDWELSLNGKSLHHENENTPRFIPSVNSYYFGAGHHSRFNGIIAETILFDRKLDEDERKKVNSYLAFKYGLTLKGENNSLIDYVASNGSLMWTASNNNDYGNRITGIGRDDNGALYQKQSKSQVDGANITIALGNEIKTTNMENTNSIEKDKSFFVFSDNGQDDKFVNPTDNNNENLKHMDRIYKVEKTNWEDSILTLEVEQVEGASEWPLYLVISKDDQFDKNDSFHQLTDGKVTLNSNEFANGAYFTIAAPVPEIENVELEQTVSDGNKIALTFDREVEVIDLSGFTIKIDDEDVTMADVDFEVDPNDETKLILTLPNGTEVTGKEVKVAYKDEEGNLKGKNGVPVSDFEEVVNDSFAEALKITEPSGAEEPIQVTTPKPEIKGEVEPGSDVLVVIKDENGNPVESAGPADVDENGNWTFKPSTDLEDGMYTIEVTALKDNKIATKARDIEVAIPEPSLEITQPVEDKVFKSKPEFNGTTDVGAELIVEVKDKDGNVVSTPTVTVNEDGTWSFIPENELEDGEYTVEVTATKNGKSTKESKEITVDTSLPELDVTEPEGDKIFDSKPIFKGTATPGATVEVKISDDVILTTTADEDGNWNVTPEEELEDGTYNVEVTAEKDGKTSEPVQKEIIVDTKLPVLEVIKPEEDTMTNSKPTFSGTATPGSTVTVKISDDVTLTTTADENGNWSVTPDEELADGEYTIEATAEKDGKISEPVQKELTVDTKLPELEVIKPEEDTVTNSKPTFSGTATPGSTVTVKVSDNVTLTTTADEDGNWSVAPEQELENGTYNVEVTAEKDGKTSEPVQKEMIVDATELEVAITLPTDDSVTSSTPEISGTATPNSTVTLKITDKDGKEIIKTIPVGEDGTWRYTTEAALPDGVTTIEVTAEKDGKTSKPQQKTILIDTAQEKVDKTVLQNFYDGVYDLIEDEYTPESWEKFKTTLDEASEVLNNPNATQEQVDEALNKLTSAYTDLKTETPVEEVDKSKLQKLYEVLENKDLASTDFTADTWETFENKLNEAANVLNDPDVTQEQLDQALIELVNAYEGLEKTPEANKSKLIELNDKINNENLSEEDYTADSWNSLQEALKNAETVLNNPNATQTEVDKAYEALEQARKSLVKNQEEPSVDKSALEKLTEKINNEDLSEEDYTVDSWNSLQEALKNAKTVLTDPNATQTEVDKAYEALKQARKSLVENQEEPSVDKSALEKLTDKINNEDLSEEDYTVDSWNSLQEALKNAKTVLTDPNATQAEVDKAYEALDQARKALVGNQEEPSIDKSALEKLTKKINNKNLSEEDYTVDSWNSLQEALKNAETVLNNPNATQTEVEEALKALERAYQDLKSLDKEEVIAEKVDSNKDKKGMLPNTATSIYNYLLAGFTIIIIGLLFNVIIRRKRNN